MSARPEVGELTDAQFREYIDRFLPHLVEECGTDAEREAVYQRLIDRWRGDPLREFRVWITLTDGVQALVDRITQVLAALGSNGPAVARSLLEKGYDITAGGGEDAVADCVLARYVRAEIPEIADRRLWGGGFRSGRFGIGLDKFGVVERYSNVRYPLPAGAVQFVKAPPAVLASWKAGAR